MIDDPTTRASRGRALWASRALASRALALLLAGSPGVACKATAPGGRPPELAGARQERALVFTPEVVRAADVPAYSLTASDGTSLHLAFVRVRTVVQGPLALTQLHLGFDNRGERTIEGRFAVTMPDGAAISRFAMKVAGAWQEGEVVERMTATRVYESYLHKRVDPALLEHDAGDRFRARVFPILAGERKELIVSYSQELADPRAPYRLPLLGLPRLDALDVQVFVAGATADSRVLTIDRRDYVPEGDLVLRDGLAQGSAGLRNGSLVGARVELIAEAGAAATTSGRAAGWTFLLDTSASQAPGFAARVRRLGPLIAALAAREARDISVEVIGFDQEQVLLYRGPGSGFGAAQIDRVIARGALGASDLAAALREAKRAAKAGARVVLVSDGIATIGETRAGALTAAAGEVRAAGVTRIDAVAGAGDRDALLAVAVPQAPGGLAGAVLDGGLPVDALVDRLFAPVLRDVAVEVPGSRWVWPRRLDGVQPGDSVLVYAELDERTPLRVQFKAAGLREQSVATEAVVRPLLERAWRGAQLRDLVAQHGQLAVQDRQRDPLRAQIVDLSRAHRILSPFTAMLVLETEDDYRRFQLDRRALSDILVVDDVGLNVLQRDLAGVLSAAREATKGRSGASAVPLEAGAPGPADGPVTPIDSDSDGVSDAVDRCPMMPEDMDGDQDWDGCPDVLLIDNCQLRLPEKIYFDSGSAVVLPTMHRVLDDVVATLNAAPGIDLWVDGHTDSKGTDAASKILSQRRVDAVAEYLVGAGVDPQRIEPRGMGEMVPIADNKTAQGRAANRRVEFNLKDCQRSIVSNGWRAGQGTGVPALAGRFLAVDEALRREPGEALRLARAWALEQPGDVLAALALGRALAAVGQPSAAARAYGSLIDLSPSRAEYRRHAGQRFEAIGAFDLAVDSYRQAVSLRPDHPASHRLLAFALARLGRHAEAFAALQVGLAQGYPPGRFPAIEESLRDDLAILGAAWIRGEPAAAPEVKRRLAAVGRDVADVPSLRFVLTWETDATDVDLHILDARGHHIYGHRSGRDWRTLVENTEGYGPETQVLGGSAREYPYTVHVYYARRGAMGDAMGAVQVLEHDGQGRLGFATLPFVLMDERASLELGAVPGSLLAGGGGAALAGD